MKMELPEIGPDERTPLVETLLGLIRQLMDRVAELERVNQELRDENARLKGQKGRPDLKPSTLEKPEKPSGCGRRWDRKRPTARQADRAPDSGVGPSRDDPGGAARSSLRSHLSAV
jgi:hypothetical protein